MASGCGMFASGQGVRGPDGRYTLIGSGMADVVYGASYNAPIALMAPDLAPSCEFRDAFGLALPANNDAAPVSWLT
jgi:hypothetical protein